MIRKAGDLTIFIYALDLSVNVSQKSDMGASACGWRYLVGIRFDF